MARTAIVLNGGAKRRASEKGITCEVPCPAESAPPPKESLGPLLERPHASSDRIGRREGGPGPGGQESVAEAGVPKRKKRGKRSSLVPHAGSDRAGSDAPGLNPVLNKLGSCSASQDSSHQDAPAGKGKRKGSVTVTKEDGEEFIEPPDMLGRKVCSVCFGPGGGKGSDIFLECRT